ncbi:DUF3658 domain-containing protein [Aquitalea aquatilis]|uniref:DUF3658 domain-containing protein n=1 Tax=Aquitalea aquatilis TaxID=1537400 RepID=UPI0010BDA55C|nr:DUF1835 domain-containing protein [Aquitalea aquatilis]
MTASGQVLHVVQGGNAAALLRQVLADAEVLAFEEDFSHGPLADADTIDPQLRMAWWNRIWWSHTWWPDIDQQFQLAWWQSRKRLFRALSEQQPLCVWLGNTVHDQLMLAMLAANAHPDQLLTVQELAGQVASRHNGFYAVAMCTVAELQPLLARPRTLLASERAQRIALWRHWQQHANGWRGQIDGQLQDYPAAHFDARLLALLREQGEQPAARLLGMLMGQLTSELVGDSYLFWRLAALAEAGLLGLKPQPDGPPIISPV